MEPAVPGILASYVRPK